MLPSAPLAAGTCGLHGRRRRGAYISTCAVQSTWAQDLPVTTATRHAESCMVPCAPRCCCLQLLRVIEIKKDCFQQKHTATQQLDNTL